MMMKFKATTRRNKYPNIEGDYVRDITNFLINKLQGVCFAVLVGGVLIAIFTLLQGNVFAFSFFEIGVYIVVLILALVGAFTLKKIFWVPTSIIITLDEKEMILEADSKQVHYELEKLVLTVYAYDKSSLLSPSYKMAILSAEDKSCYLFLQDLPANQLFEALSQGVDINEVRINHYSSYEGIYTLQLDRWMELKHGYTINSDKLLDEYTFKFRPSRTSKPKNMRKFTNLIIPPLYFKEIA